MTDSMDEALRAAFGEMKAPASLVEQTVRAARDRAAQQAVAPVSERVSASTSSPMRGNETAPAFECVDMAPAPLPVRHSAATPEFASAPAEAAAFGQHLGGEGRTAVSVVDFAAAPTSAKRAAKKPLAKIYRIRIAATLAACMVLAAVGVGGAAAWASVEAVVQVDVNPSVELSLNRFNVVVGARGLNEDGMALLESCDVTGASYEDALDALFASAEFASLVTDDAQTGEPLDVSVSVACENSQRCDALAAGAQECVNKASGNGMKLRYRNGHGAHAGQSDTSSEGTSTSDEKGNNVQGSGECAAEAGSDQENQCNDESLGRKGEGSEGKGKGQGEGHRYGAGE